MPPGPARWLWFAVAPAAVFFAASIVLVEWLSADGDHPGSSPEAREGAIAKGPHGGWFVRTGRFGIEVAIFERDGPAKFRIYAWEDGTPLDVRRVNLSLYLQRPGEPAHAVPLRWRADFMEGEREVAKPYSFTVTIEAKHGNRLYRWTYAQAEGAARLKDSSVQESR